MSGAHGHALRLLPKAAEAKQLAEQGKSIQDSRYLYLARPSTLRVLGGLLQIAEKHLAAVVNDVVARAAKLWPDAIESSLMTGWQKMKLRAHLESHPAIAALRRREQLAAERAKAAKPK